MTTRLACESFPQLSERRIVAGFGICAVICLMKRMGWRLGAFALLALLVRAIVPAGYMLAHAETGSGRYLTVELCDSHNSKAQVIDLDTGEIVDLPETGGSSEQHQPCVFAGMVAAPVLHTIDEAVVFAAERDVEFGAVRDLRPGRGIAAPPPPSTGPPSFI